jgi:hypothetical protein
MLLIIDDKISDKNKFVIFLKKLKFYYFKRIKFFNYLKRSRQYPMTILIQKSCLDVDLNLKLVFFFENFFQNTVETLEYF